MQHYSKFIQIFTISIGAFAAFCLGLAAGYVVFHPEVFVQANQKPQEEIINPVVTPTINKETTFRLEFQQREQEHTFLLLHLLQSTYDGASDINAASLQVTASNNERAELLSNYYGKKTSFSYKKLQEDYAENFITYTNAVKKNNKVTMNKSLDQLLTNTASQAALLGSVNKNASENGFNELATNSVLLLKASIDAYAVQNYPLAYSKERESFAQVGEIAATHATAIIHSYPEKFK